jgi:polyisoprenoid-binding protein YceI
MIRTAALSALALVAVSATAAPETYNIDASHTYPAFEADHMGGLSVWRGKFNTTSGSVMLDTAAKVGEINVTIDMASVNFGHDKMNEHARSGEIFDTAKYPTAIYKGKVSKWNGDAPAEVAGQLTMHGITRPVTLTVNSFLCKANPMNRKRTCGADASATLNREDFGVDYGKSFGFNMSVKLLISIEAVKAN